MIIETKYDIGEQLFYLDLRDNRVTIRRATIKQINAGGKVWEEYDLGGVTRSERELYKDFTDAKVAAIEKQIEQNNKLMDWINETTEEQTVKRL